MDSLSCDRRHRPISGLVDAPRLRLVESYVWPTSFPALPKQRRTAVAVWKKARTGNKTNWSSRTPPNTGRACGDRLPAVTALCVLASSRSWARRPAKEKGARASLRYPPLHARRRPSTSRFRYVIMVVEIVGARSSRRFHRRGGGRRALGLSAPDLTTEAKRTPPVGGSARSAVQPFG